MCTEINVRRAFLCVFVSISLLAGLADAQIIVPTIVSEANTNSFGAATTDKLTDNSGMTPAVNAGDSLESALAATHVYGGVYESWVTNAAAPDYFAASLAPEFVWDVTGGGNSSVGSIILWQYQNDGGGTGRVGNHAYAIDLQFNTEAEGSVVFAGPTTTVYMEAVLDGVNDAQGFDLNVDECRYVRMVVSDNHYGQPSIVAGGDRVGIGELRFAPVPDVANTPNPASGAQDVCPNVVLSWNPGEDAEKHDVYFGTDFDSVNNASTSTPLGVLVSVGQIETYYPLSGSLTLGVGTTYYWRVDEVKGAPPSTAKGTVWQFSTEPLAYPVENVTATASSSEAGKGPENTLSLDGDLHSNDTSAMWLSGSELPGEAWIQYEFDKIYKLREMWVWNYNGETLNTAFGLREVTIEYSTDGDTWTELSGVGEFAQAPGSNGYAHETPIALDGAVAKYLRITANSSWGGDMVDRYGLSEVRFFYVPVRSGEPFPENEATDVPIDTILSWTPGRGAAMHDVYLSTDARAVAEGAVDPCSIAADGACRATYDPLLELGRTYYWKVNEVNMVEEPNTWEGDIWSFSTPEYVLVDTMETYTPYNVENNNIFEVWLDGVGNCTDPGNGTGSIVSVQEGSPAQGAKSMKYEYDNDGMVPNPCNPGTEEPRDKYSEAKANVADLPSGIGSDWRAAGAKALVLQFYGTTTNAIEDMWIELTDGAGGNATVTYGDYDGENPTDINDPSWHQWNINLQDFDDGGVNLADVTSIAIGIGNPDATSPGGSGLVYFDDIRLYPSRCILSKRSADFAAFDYAGGDCVIDYKELEVMAADWLASDRTAPPLMGWYKLDEGFGTTTQDDSGNGNHGTLNGAPQWMAGYIGAGSLQFNGSGDEVEVPYNPALNPTDTFTVAAWINLTPGGTGHRAVVSCRDDVPGSARGYILYVRPDGSPSFWTGHGNANAWYAASGPVINESQWVHVAATYEVGTLRVYVDGVMEDESTAATFGINTTQELLIGAGRNEGATHAYYFQGLIDDVRIYDRTLSQTEIASIMDGTLGSVSDYHPLLLPAELDAGEPEGSRAVNFKDFAVLVSRWLDAELWP